MGPASGNSESKQALRADRASFETVPDCYATIIGRYTNSAADAAVPNDWAFRLDEMVHDNEHASSGIDQIRSRSGRKVSSIIKINRKKLRSLIQVEVWSEVETAQQEEMKIISITLAEETISAIVVTDYCAATSDVKDSSYFFESVVTEMIPVAS